MINRHERMRLFIEINNNKYSNQFLKIISQYILEYMSGNKQQQQQQQQQQRQQQQQQQQQQQLGGMFNKLLDQLNKLTDVNNIQQGGNQQIAGNIKVYTGPKEGKFIINKRGKKVYIDRKTMNNNVPYLKKKAKK